MSIQQSFSKIYAGDSHRFEVERKSQTPCIAPFAGLTSLKEWKSGSSFPQVQFLLLRALWPSEDSELWPSRDNDLWAENASETSTNNGIICRYIPGKYCNQAKRAFEKSGTPWKTYLEMLDLHFTSRAALKRCDARLRIQGGPFYLALWHQLLIKGMKVLDYTELEETGSVQNTPHILKSIPEHEKAWTETPYFSRRGQTSSTSGQDLTEEEESCSPPSTPSRKPSGPRLVPKLDNETTAEDAFGFNLSGIHSGTGSVSIHHPPTAQTAIPTTSRRWLRSRLNKTLKKTPEKNRITERSPETSATLPDIIASPNPAVKPDPDPIADDEQIVNTALIILIDALLLSFPDLELDVETSLQRKRFKYYDPTMTAPRQASNHLFSADTDGFVRELNKSTESLCAIFEVKKSPRSRLIVSDRKKLVRQESAEMACWIHEDQRESAPQSGSYPVFGEPKNLKWRLLISQDAEELYITIAEFNEQYEEYMRTDNVPHEGDALIVFRQFGVYRIDDAEQVSEFARFLLSFFIYTTALRRERDQRAEEELNNDRMARTSIAEGRRHGIRGFSR
ncbi:Hypothetical protein R9X50_00389400 [Acrodontium crateriforme]|uniref:Uncharacterized protein n=1 Tax=Acrodontium crateriforme TaxID=150365 RepID=A0AAQ3M4A3_9PEZI|nr:Hypothetical protein R9X50_00389400 [Acrodontium crateriforme]